MTSTRVTESQRYLLTYDFHSGRYFPGSYKTKGLKSKKEKKKKEQAHLKRRY